MAKKKEVKNIEVLADVQLLNEIQEAIEEVEVETPEVEAEAPVEVVEVVEEVVKPSVEEVLGDKDLVTFVNNKGELRIGQYGYISKTNRSYINVQYTC